MAKAYILNQVPSSYGAAMSMMVELLVAAGWTYKSSGDGLSGYNATGKVFVGTGSGANGWGNNRAWCRLAAPDDRREVCIQHNNGAGIRFKYSPLAKFTGGSPSANTCPSATDQRVLWGDGTDASPGIYAWFHTSIPVSGCRFYGMADDVAPYGFWIGGITIPAGGVQMALLLDPVESVPEDPDPVVWHIGTSTGFGRAFGVDAPGNSFNHASQWPPPGPNRAGSWAHTNAAGTAFEYVMPSVYAAGWSYNEANNTSAYNGTFNCFQLNPFNGKHEVLPTLWGRPYMPSYLLTNIGIKGWSKFLRWTTIQRTSGLDTLDGRKWICLGHVWLPWDGVTIPVNA